MYVITRQKFLDIPLGPAGVATWFEAWLEWRSIYIRNAGDGRATGVCRLDCTISGYPAGDVSSKAAQWSAGIPKESFTGVEAGKDDTVVVRSIVQSAVQPRLLEIVKPLFCDLTEGMALMLELVTWDGGPVTSTTIQEALVLYGLIRNGELIVKGIWPKGLPHDDGSIYKSAVWPGEGNAVGGLRKYAMWRDGLLPNPATASYSELTDGVKSIFSPSAVRHGSRFVKIIFGGTQLKENLWSFAKRTFGLLAITVVLGWLSSLKFVGGLRYLVLLAAITSGIGLAFAVGWKALLIWMFGSQMRKMFKRIYNEPWSGIEVPDAESACGDEPAFRKLSADALALGGTHLVDFRMTNTGGPNLTRVYFYSESKTYLFLLFLLENPDGGKNFPMQSTFLVRTLYENNVVVATVDQGLGFKKRLDKRSCRKMFMGVTGIADMLARHAKAAKNFMTTERGPLELSKEQLIQREICEHEESSQRNRNYGYYHWSDAFGEIFGLMRRDLVEDR
jgi:hypothetical protein